jgi:PAS domain S-box-containing protein/putative nucleotidyltransferase with HDIG domain
MKTTAAKAKKLIEPSLKDSELRYRRLFETAQDGILILDAGTGMIEDVNPYLIKMLGYSREEFVQKKLWEVGAFKDIQASRDAFEVLQDSEYIRYEDLPLKTKDGRMIEVEFVSNVYLVNKEKVIQCDIRDITEHRRIIAALQGNEKKYHDLINQSPDGYFIIELSGNILTVNKAMCKELEFSEEEFLSMNIWDIVPEQYLEQYRQRLTKVLKGESLKEAAEYEVLGKTGKNHYVEVLSAPRYSGKDVIGFQGIARDITARKRAEEALQSSEDKYRTLVAHLPTVVYTNPVGDTSSTLYVSPQIETLLGYTPQEWLADPKLWSKSLHPEDRQHVLKQAAQTDQSNKPFEMEYRMIARDGRLVWVLDQVVLVNNQEGKPQYWQGIMLDITERKQAEDALRESEERFRAWIENSTDLVTVIGLDGLIQYGSPSYEHLLGYKPEELIGKNGFDLVHPDDRDRLMGIFAQNIQTHGSAARAEFRFSHSDGSWRIFEGLGRAYLDGRGQMAGLINARDITERKQAEKRMQRQLEHLAALSSIDRVVAAITDIKLSLSEILAHVTAELEMDAAAVLLFNPHTQMLEYAAWRGFHTKAMRKAQMRLGESYAGRVALERQLIQIPNLKYEPVPTLLSGEGFVCYFGLPLIAKGQVKGVLEVFHRIPFEPDDEWFDFLHALAGQTAIAIENASLFESLQRSNTELTVAYDATIEGWSHALDLRDKETEGHTLRVTELTMKLARAFGLSDEELVQVRWGSLLHDIGKMGVPDGILLKPGELTEEEWAKMKEHPGFAYELLSPIRFLRQALDIPYCHHEKWDGTGYPRGLQGEQIPLAARIFAVVDVWDALNSDRPYRAAWPEEKVREHIRALSGTHFDPHVVDVFMQLLD